MKHICVVTPCYNEKNNISELIQRVKNVFSELPEYNYEHLFSDNASTDGTTELLEDIAKTDKHIKAIFNTRNFGATRSAYNALLQSKADATILLLADMQDPPELIKDFLIFWEKGFKIVAGVKPKSKESARMLFLRTTYYRIIGKLSEVKLVKNFFGFGLYDKLVIKTFKDLKEPEPYFRGLVAEIGYPIKEVSYVQEERKHGKSNHNFYMLYDVAMSGITSHSKLPLRVATMLGFESVNKFV